MTLDDLLDDMAATRTTSAGTPGAINVRFSCRNTPRSSIALPSACQVATEPHEPAGLDRHDVLDTQLRYRQYLSTSPSSSAG